MFIISNADWNGSQQRDPSATGTNAGHAADRNASAPETQPDATQRVRIPQNAPQRPQGTPARRPQASAPQQPPVRRKPSRKKNNKILTITAISITAVLLVAILITSLFMLSTPKDDGLILNNVFAAGVNLGGMTPEQAKTALHNATDNTYTKLDMVIQVLEETVTLSPADTGAKLDVDKVVELAYNYGRTGTRAEREKAKNQALTSAYHISIQDHLNLNLQYINGVMEELGNKYGSILLQPSVVVNGTRPPLVADAYDTTFVHQTLVITMGTPEYGLNTDDLWEQIMDAYNINLFQVTAQCTMLSPNTLDVDELYNEHCVPAVNATIDEFYNTTPEAYGYGFDLEALKLQVATAGYGQVIEVPLTYIAPAITLEDLAGNLFQDILGQCITELPEDANILKNLRQACKAINGTILEAGAQFSFNGIVGEPTVRRGYYAAYAFSGKNYEEVVGGGISQVASTLYLAAILADLNVTERYNHYYAPTFSAPGLDADVKYGSMDLKFTNNTENPIRIEAIMDGSQVKVVLWGTDDKDYTVRISYETIHTYQPTTLIQMVRPDYTGTYQEGDVLQEGIIGFDVISYKSYIYNNPEDAPETDDEDGVTEIEIAQSHYEKRNEIIVGIQEEEPEVTVPPTTEPIVPPTTIPGDPSTTDPTDPTEPTVPTVPSEPTEPGNTEE